MKKTDEEDSSEIPEDATLRFRSRPKSQISLALPTEALASANEIALRKGMSVEALLQFYIGQGLRSDISEGFSAKILEKTARVLERHQVPADEVTGILTEIRREAAMVSR